MRWWTPLWSRLRACQVGAVCLVLPSWQRRRLLLRAHRAALRAPTRACAGNAKARVAKQLPDFVDVFGWCTWDAFYSRVSAEGELRLPLA